MVLHIGYDKLSKHFVVSNHQQQGRSGLQVKKKSESKLVFFVTPEMKSKFRTSPISRVVREIMLSFRRYKIPEKLEKFSYNPGH